MEQKKAQKNKQKKRVSKRFFFLLASVAGAVALCAMLYTQEAKMREISREKAQLTEEYEALLTEQERLEYMIEYAKSDEYRLQYAREILGYVLPNDIKFSAGN